MSNYFESPRIEDHLRGVRDQLEVFRTAEDIPHNLYLDTAFGIANMGKKGFLLRGDQGSGKTTTAATIVGSENIVSMGRTDTRQSLYGTERQFVDGYTSGSIGKILLKGQGLIGLDEIGDVEDIRALHALANLDGINIQNGNTFVETEDMVLVMTSNHKMGNLVFGLPKETRDRVAGEISLGSVIEDETDRALPKPGLVAPTAVRQSLRRYMAEKFPSSENDSIKDRTVKVVREMTSTGMFDDHYIPKSPRITGGIKHAVRANKLIESVGTQEGKIILPQETLLTGDDLTEVAAFTLGARAELSEYAISKFSEALGGKTVDEQTKAIIRNRLIAGIAAKVELSAAADINPKDLVKKLTGLGTTVESMIRNNMQNHSYATLEDSHINPDSVTGVAPIEVIDEEIMKILFDKQKKIEVKDLNGANHEQSGILQRTLARLSFR